MEQEKRSFLDTGFDFSHEEFEPAEKEAILKWYAEVHDYQGLDLAPFARFWIDTDPGGFKLLKRHLLTLEESRDRVSLPVAAGVLMYAFTYTALGNGKGAFYEIIAARAVGATKAQIVELVRIAALFGGPIGLNPLAARIGDYMDEWTEDGDQPIEWPAGWAPSVEAFRSGIDFGTDDLSAGELDLIAEWHERMHGEVPDHVRVVAELHPTAYKTQRIRQEAAITGALPAQLVPLLMLHLGVVDLNPTLIRRSAQMARALGVRRHQVVSTLFWATTGGGEWKLEQALEPCRDVLSELR
jgi:hypothetical protein